MLISFFSIAFVMVAVFLAAILITFITVAFLTVVFLIGIRTRSSDLAAYLPLVGSFITLFTDGSVQTALFRCAVAL